MKDDELQAYLSRISGHALIESEIPVDSIIESCYYLRADLERVEMLIGVLGTARDCGRPDITRSVLDAEQAPVVMFMDDGTYLPVSGFELLFAYNMLGHENVRALVAMPKFKGASLLEDLISNPKDVAQAFKAQRHHLGVEFCKEGYANVDVCEHPRGQVSSLTVNATIGDRNYIIVATKTRCSVIKNSAALAAPEELRQQDMYDLNRLLEESDLQEALPCQLAISDLKSNQGSDKK